MATEVFTTEEITLLDGTEVELRPLPIIKLRKFMRLWSDHMDAVRTAISEKMKEDPEGDINDSDLTDKQFDVFIDMAALGLEAQLKGEKTTKQFSEYLEGVLNEKTIYYVINATGGLKLGEDTNPQTPVTTNPAGGTN